MNILDMLFLTFTVISLYFIFLFLVLFFEHRKKMSIVPKMKKLPTVSILVPVHNEANIIGKTIENLKKLKYQKPIEIIVIDDGSTDNTAEIARKAGAKVLRKEKGGKANALNYGLKFAKGELIACIDADSFPERDALLKSIVFFEEPNVAAVTTKILIKRGKGILRKLQEVEYAMVAWSRKLLEFMESIYATPGPFALYRKKILEEIGGFDERNATEDIEIAWRILDKGYKIRMSPAKTYTRPPKTFKKWWKQRIRWNIGGLQTTMKYKNAFFKRGSLGFFVLPFFFLSYILTLIALGIFIYLIFAFIFNFIFFSFFAVSIGLNPLAHVNINLLPNVFTVFGTAVLVLSIILLKFGLVDMKKSVRDWPSLVIYLTFYLMIFPFLLIHSIAKYKGYEEW